MRISNDAEFTPFVCGTSRADFEITRREIYIFKTSLSFI